MEIEQLRTMSIGSLEVAQKKLLRKLVDRGFHISNVSSVNQGRYSIIEGKMNNELKKYLLIYKRDFFHNFGLELRHLGARGLGETINCEELKQCLRTGVTDIYCIYPNGSCYTIPLTDFLSKSIRWINKEGKEVRSISIHELKREYNLI